MEKNRTKPTTLSTAVMQVPCNIVAVSSPPPHPPLHRRAFVLNRFFSFGLLSPLNPFFRVRMRRVFSTSSSLAAPTVKTRYVFVFSSGPHDRVHFIRFFFHPSSATLCTDRCGTRIVSRGANLKFAAATVEREPWNSRSAVSLRFDATGKTKYPYRRFTMVNVYFIKSAKKATNPFLRF